MKQLILLFLATFLTLNLSGQCQSNHTLDINPDKMYNIVHIFNGKIRLDRQSYTLDKEMTLELSQLNCKKLVLEASVKLKVKNSNQDTIKINCDQLLVIRKQKILTEQHLKINTKELNGKLDIYSANYIGSSKFKLIPTPKKQNKAQSGKSGANGRNGRDASSSGFKTKGSTRGNNGGNGVPGISGTTGIVGRQGSTGRKSISITLESEVITPNSFLTIIAKGEKGQTGGKAGNGGDGGNGGKGGTGGKGGRAKYARNPSRGGTGGNGGTGGTGGTGGKGGKGGHGGNGGFIKVSVSKEMPSEQLSKWLYIASQPGEGGEGGKGGQAGNGGIGGQKGTGGRGGDGSILKHGGKTGLGGSNGNAGRKGGKGSMGDKGDIGQKGIEKKPFILMKDERMDDFNFSQDHLVLFN